MQPTEKNEIINPPLTITVRGVVASTMRQHTAIDDTDPARRALTRCVETAGQFGSAYCSMRRDAWQSTIAAVREAASKDPDDKYNQKLNRYIAEVEAPLAAQIRADKQELGHNVATELEGIKIRINNAMDALPAAESRERETQQKLREVVQEHPNTPDHAKRLAAASAEHDTAVSNEGKVRQMLGQARDDLRIHAAELDYVLGD